MNNNSLTLVITIHSNMDSINFFLDILKGVKNKVFFSFDNPDVPQHLIKLIYESGYDFFINKKNTGKLKLILKSSKYIDTRFVKIIDQDDSISVDDLNKLNKKINLINYDCLIKHKAFKILSSSDYFFQTTDKTIISKQIKESEDIFYNQQTNCDTIYPTKFLIKLAKFENKLNRQDFHNDVLISNFMIAMGLKLEILEEGFYIQFHENGQTNQINHKRSVCIYELYDNYNILRKRNKDFDIKRTTGKKIESHLNFIKRFTLNYNSDPKKNEIIYKKTKKLLEKM